MNNDAKMSLDSAKLLDLSPIDILTAQNKPIDSQNTHWGAVKPTSVANDPTHT